MRIYNARGSIYENEFVAANKNSRRYREYRYVEIDDTSQKIKVLAYGGLGRNPTVTTDKRLKQVSPEVPVMALRSAGIAILEAGKRDD